MACAIARGLDGRIRLHPSGRHASPADLVADNPTSKVPCLVTDDGLSLDHSPVICEFLDSLEDAPALFPELSAPRWRALKFQAMGDGILDAAVPCRGEMAGRGRLRAMRRSLVTKPRCSARSARWKPIRRTDMSMSASIAAVGARADPDFRYGGDPWRPGHPKLTAWFEGVREASGDRADHAQGMIDSSAILGADAASVIAALDLRPHPEGGHFRETWRDVPQVGGRGAGTAILFLLRDGEVSHWHRVDAAELWIGRRAPR